MPEERTTRKDKINDAREERRMKTLTEAQDAKFGKRIWQVAGAASVFMLVSSLSVGLGIGLATGNLTGGNNSSNVAGTGNGSTETPVSPGEPAATATKGAQTNPANAATDGFIFTSVGQIIASDPVNTPEPAIDNPDKVDLKIYLDYSCSFCKIFEEVEGENISRALVNPDVNISYHILAFLGEYSKAAGNASTCVASLEPAKWDEVNAKLFEGSEGGANAPSLSEAGGYVSNLLAPIGLGKETYSCINELRHVDWLDAATGRAFSEPQTTKGDKMDGTPTVVADSDIYSGPAFQAIGNFPGIMERHLGLLGK